MILLVTLHTIPWQVSSSNPHHPGWVCDKCWFCHSKCPEPLLSSYSEFRLSTYCHTCPYDTTNWVIWFDSASVIWFGSNINTSNIELFIIWLKNKISIQSALLQWFLLGCWALHFWSTAMCSWGSLKFCSTLSRAPIWAAICSLTVLPSSNALTWTQSRNHRTTTLCTRSKQTSDQNEAVIEATWVFNYLQRILQNSQKWLYNSTLQPCNAFHYRLPIPQNNLRISD